MLAKVSGLTQLPFIALQHMRTRVGQMVEVMLLPLDQVGWNGHQLAPGKLHAKQVGSVTSLNYVLSSTQAKSR